MMSSTRFMSTVVSSNAIRMANQQSRNLSTQSSVAAQKLKNALEEYRRLHYTQEVPSRFRKDIVRAAKHDASNEITIDSMRRLLLNINKEDAISLEEMDVLFREMGGECRKIAADRMMKLI